MIRNALTKAKHGGRLPLMCRSLLEPSPVSKPALTLRRLGAPELHQPWTTRPLSQRRFHTTGFSPFSDEYDTIYALSTAPGRAAIAIVRISGPGWQDVCSASFHPNSMLTSMYRYTKHYAPMPLLQSLVQPRYETSTTPPIQLTSSIQPSSSISQPQEP
jgi:GTP-binding protein TrmE N-terminus